MKNQELKRKLLRELQAIGFRCKFRRNDLWSDWSASPRMLCHITYIGWRNTYRTGTVTRWKVENPNGDAVCYSDDIPHFARTVLYAGSVPGCHF